MEIDEASTSTGEPTTQPHQSQGTPANPRGAAPTKTRQEGRPSSEKKGRPASVGKIIEDSRAAQKQARGTARERLRDRRRNTQAAHAAQSAIGAKRNNKEAPPSPIGGPGWEESLESDDSCSESSFSQEPQLLPPNQLGLESGTQKVVDRVRSREDCNMAISEESLIKILDDRLKSLAKSAELDYVVQKCDETAANTTRLAIRVEEMERKINDKNYQSEMKIREVVKTILGERPPSVSDMSVEENSIDLERESIGGGIGRRELRRGGSRGGAYDEDYDVSRRSMRIWPVRGSTRGELERDLDAFLKHALMLTEEEMDKIRVEEITRCRTQTNTPIHQEVCVRFGSRTERDNIAMRGAKLAGYIDEKGRPTAGMRMDVPTHLNDTFRALREVAFGVRSTHGRRSKTHIKFDDLHRDLYLEVRLEGERAWTRIDSELAREMQRETSRASARRLVGHDRRTRRSSFGDPEGITWATGGNNTPIGGQLTPNTDVWQSQTEETTQQVRTGANRTDAAPVGRSHGAGTRRSDGSGDPQHHQHQRQHQPPTATRPGGEDRTRADVPDGLGATGVWTPAPRERGE